MKSILRFFFLPPTTYMTYLTTDDPGYVSDTGPRDNPTAADFEQKQPVKAVIGKPNLPNGSRIRGLNREGRATARIVYSNPQWRSVTKISRVFNVGKDCIKKAIKNDYSPPDDPLQDYNKVSKEFTEKFPPHLHAKHYIDSDPLSVEQRPMEKRKGVEEDAAKACPSRALRAEHSECFLTLFQTLKKRRYSTESERRIRRPTKRALASQQPESPPDEKIIQGFRAIRDLPPRPARSHGKQALPLGSVMPDSLATFLTDILGLGVDFSKHQLFIQEKGLNGIDMLCVLARLNDDDIRDVLERLFARQPETESNGLLPVELGMLQGAIRRLSCEQHVPAGAPPDSLLSFLRNTMGLGWAKNHLRLFEAGGFTMDILWTISVLDNKTLRVILERLPKLSKVELAMLETAIRGLNKTRR
ncbi:hypothetical protein DFH08DRAFT_1079845 [Mycena albidolilacea]|uniref:Uncharacterized protein n=1 Tax=Mycena albidolilacea TaxID=1033008 RepID=A0AAD7A2N3_9AGAR|nr:hypothetical protein DFH08DRAFT_1079845 [Mycena albidolilacea]